MLKHVALPLVGVLVLLVACSSSGHEPPAANGTAAAPSATSAPPQGTDAGTGACGVFQTGTDVRVIVTPGDMSECQLLSKDLSSSGSFWTVRDQPVTNGQITLVCAMKTGGYVARVEDTGGQLNGQDVCSGFLTSGWTEDTDVENQTASAASAAASAQASASAAASAAQQLAQDESTAHSLISAIATDISKLATDRSGMDSDLRGEAKDLASLKTDAAGGQGDNCYNVQTVAYDAEQNVGYDATQNVGYDATQNVGYDLDALRQDASKLQAIVQTIDSEGGSAPTDTAASLSTASTAASEAVTAANSDIDQANALATTAYATARSLATGSCADSGPGTYTPVPHIH
jgi:hypothetical protein